MQSWEARPSDGLTFRGGRRPGVTQIEERQGGYGDYRLAQTSNHRNRRDKYAGSGLRPAGGSGTPPGSSTEPLLGAPAAAADPVKFVLALCWPADWAWVRLKKPGSSPATLGLLGDYLAALANQLAQLVGVVLGSDCWPRRVDNE